MIAAWKRKEQTWTARWNGVQLCVAFDTDTRRWAAFADNARHPHRWRTPGDAIRAMDTMISCLIRREVKKNLEVPPHAQSV